MYSNSIILYSVGITKSRFSLSNISGPHPEIYLVLVSVQVLQKKKGQAVLKHATMMLAQEALDLFNKTKQVNAA